MLDSVRTLHEEDQLEPALRDILFDPNSTPHGPTEIADILTGRVTMGGRPTTAAFVLKGRSFQRVRSTDVAHQFIRLRQVPGVGVWGFVAVGDIQDGARRDFVQTAMDAGVDYLTIDAHDVARLLIAYEKLCPQDGSWYSENGICELGHVRDPGIKLEYQVGDEPRYEIINLRDISHGGAKRYSAVVHVDKHYPRDILRRIIQGATDQVRFSNYHRNDMVEARWGGTPAHVVWLVLAYDLEDVRRSNWVGRAEWIDPALDEAMRPRPMTGDEQLGAISVEWNAQYEQRKELYARYEAPKGEVLSRIRPVLRRMMEIGDHTARLFDAYKRGEITPAAFERHMVSGVPEVSELYMASGDLPAPPEDLKDYDRVCHQLFSEVDNMYLFFTELANGKWSQSNRDSLIQAAIKRYERDKLRLEFEEEKIH